MAQVTFEAFTGKFPDQTIDQIKALDKNEFPWPWSDKQWEILNSTRDFLLIVALNGDQVIAFSLLDCDFISNNAHLHKIIISSDFRGGELSVNLFNKICFRLRSLRVNEIYLEVAVGNFRAIGYYEKNGFKVVHRKKKFYNDGQDALIMTSQI